MDPCGDVGDGSKSISARPSNVSWDPYVIWSADECSTLGGPEEFERVTRAARQDLEVQTSHKIEEIFWTNTVDSADFGGSHPNVGLSDASLVDLATIPTQAQIDSGTIYTPLAFDSVPIVTAFKEMIGALTDMLGGARGMIHCEARVVPFITYAGLAVQNGQRLTTTLGNHIVVPGTGYTGSSPNEEASSEFYSWIYGTSMVEVLLGPVEVFGDRAALTNRDINTIEIRAERIALAHFDRQAHIGISVCLEDPFGTCSDTGS